MATASGPATAASSSAPSFDHRDSCRHPVAKPTTSPSPSASTTSIPLCTSASRTTPAPEAGQRGRAADADRGRPDLVVGLGLLGPVVVDLEAPVPQRRRVALDAGAIGVPGNPAVDLLLGRDVVAALVPGQVARAEA